MTVEMLAGDCLEVLPTLAENSVDSCVCDPPYHLVSVYKRFANEPRTEATVGNGAYGRHAKGFMGKQWDGGDIAFRPDVWREVWRVLKPGAHLLAFGGTRTYHRMACAIEDAGFEIRDCIMWVYGSGFPKSHNVGNGWGTALKPACEPIVLARKPLSEGTVAANVLRWGTGAINVDGCRIAGQFKSGWSDSGSGDSENIAMSGRNYAREPKPDNANGRWPANLIHDGSEEVVAGFPDLGLTAPSGFDDSGSVARFFYTAKADTDDRLGSKHPTVKPLDLMQYLVRLVTPPKGLVLDPFAGTGTTGEAAFREGCNAVLIEREAEYQADIKRRIAMLLGGPEERAREAIKERMKDKPRDDGPLFA